MPRFAIRPKIYHDRLDAIYNYLVDAQERGRVLQPDRNPNGKLEMLAWAYDEIVRLRHAAEIKLKKRHAIGAVLAKEMEDSKAE